ncbi:MAG: tyrosine-type recombinase/integrase [Firmicutes bacterium]|nr:tyrosine-type recombinase/integrase [Bacillota bacterium]
MRIIQTSLINQKTLVFNYLPAKLCKNRSGWLIEYYVENPINSDICRVRKRVNFIKKRYNSVRDAESHCQKIIFDINSKLANGINPMFSEENPAGYITIAEVVKRFLDEKNRETRPDTMRSYISFSRRFQSYVSKNSSMFICKFGKIEAARYMDWVYSTRKISQRAFNNYLKFMRLLFNWAIEKGYVLANPFNIIKTKKKEAKTRIIIDTEIRKKITDYLKEKDKKFLIVLKLVYSALIRPKEIMNLRVSDIDFESKTVCVNSSVSKNHTTRHITLTNDILIDLAYIKDYKKDMFLFSVTMLPGYTKANNAKYTKMWDKLRKELKLDKTMQLYSLRDTGITEMLKIGIDPLSVKQHADHHSLEMTTIYSNHVDPNLAKIIREKAPTF